MSKKNIPCPNCGCTTTKVTFSTDLDGSAVTLKSVKVQCSSCHRILVRVNTDEVKSPRSSNIAKELMNEVLKRYYKLGSVSAKQNK